MRNFIKKIILGLPVSKGLHDLAYKWIYAKQKQAIIASFPKSEFASRELMYDYIMEHELKHEPISYMEFGVFHGDSIRYWSEKYKNAESRFYGFDTFTGLPENWTPDRPKGSFDVQGKIPDIDDTRVEFFKGLFTSTLPGFFESRFENSKRNVIHLDADLFSSTMYVLNALLLKLKKGDIIIFDEWDSHLLHEFRAFADFFSYSGIEYAYLKSARNYFELAIIIK